MAAVTLNAMRRPVTVRNRNVREVRPTPVTTPQTSDGPEAARPVGGVGLAGSVASATGPPASRLVVTRAASRTGRCNGYSRLGDVDADRPRQAANRCPSADPDGPTTHSCLPASEHARAPNCTGSCEPSESAIRAGMRSRRRPMNAGRFSPVEPFAPMAGRRGRFNRCAPCELVRSGAQECGRAYRLHTAHALHFSCERRIEIRLVSCRWSGTPPRARHRSRSRFGHLRRGEAGIRRARASDELQARAERRDRPVIGAALPEPQTDQSRSRLRHQVVASCVVTGAASDQ